MSNTEIRDWAERHGLPGRRAADDDRIPEWVLARYCAAHPRPAGSGVTPAETATTRRGPRRAPAKPTKREPEAHYTRRNPWPVSGGLPGLGRRP